MEEHDFSIRNELESLDGQGEESRNLLSAYNTPEGKGPKKGFLSFLRNNREQVTNALPKKEFSGFQLNIESDLLRWIVLLIVIVVIVWLVLSYLGKKTRRNPMKRLEKKLNRIESLLPKKLNLENF